MGYLTCHVRDRIAYGGTESTVGACEGPLASTVPNKHIGKTFDDNRPLTSQSRSCHFDGETLRPQFYSVLICDIGEIITNGL
jgi:hypothetical protein